MPQVSFRKETIAIRFGGMKYKYTHEDKGSRVFLPSTNEVWGKVLFYTCVCHSVHRCGGGWGRGGGGVWWGVAGWTGWLVGVGWG